MQTTTRTRRSKLSGGYTTLDLIGKGKAAEVVRDLHKPADKEEQSYSERQVLSRLLAGWHTNMRLVKRLMWRRLLPVLKIF